MFPVVPPGGVDSTYQRRLESTEVSAATGAQAVVGLDPQAPRAPAMPVAGPEGQAVQIKKEQTALQALPEANRSPALADEVLFARPTPNSAVQVAPRLQLLLQMLQQLGVADESAEPQAIVKWPPAGKPVGSDPEDALQNLREALGSSPLFSANPRTPATLAASPFQSHALKLGKPLVAGGEQRAAADNAQTSAQVAAQSSPQAALQSALPDVQNQTQTQQALQLLLNGQLQWAGELTPGVQARLQRKDAWREDPDHPGKLLRGTALRIEVNLPNTGPLIVLAQQVGGQMSVNLQPGEQDLAHFDAALDDLRTALAPLSETPVELALQALQTDPDSEARP